MTYCGHWASCEEGKECVHTNCTHLSTDNHVCTLNKRIAALEADNNRLKDALKAVEAETCYGRRLAHRQDKRCENHKLGLIAAKALE